MLSCDSETWWAVLFSIYMFELLFLLILPSHLTLALVKSKDSGLVVIGGNSERRRLMVAYPVPPLLTSLIVVDLAFTLDSSLAVIWSYCGVVFIGNSEKRRHEWWWFISGLFLHHHHALNSLLLVVPAFTLAPSSVVIGSNYESGVVFNGGLAQS